MTSVIGWDLGGANLKLAHVEEGSVMAAALTPCPLLSRPDKFDRALAEALARCPSGAAHAVTMTGELSDVFSGRAQGVAYLVGLMREATGDRALFYGARTGLLDADQAVERWSDVASANWHASATLAAARCADGLLVDVGTTTTDLVPLKGARPAVRAFTDGERLAEGELIYTGVVRTPVMAVAGEAPFRGRRQRIAAERFATMADVWRLTGDLPPDADPYPAADHRGKSTEESAGRLARMLGRDASEAGLLAWTDVARFFGACQVAKIETAAQALCARESLQDGAPVIGAGCGRFVAKRLAERLRRPYLDFAEIADCAPGAREMAARCAPAVAVALLRAGLPSLQSERVSEPSV